MVEDKSIKLSTGVKDMNNYTEPPIQAIYLDQHPSFKFLDVSFGALRLKFSLARFFFLIFTFCYLLLSYASPNTGKCFLMEEK